MGGKRGCALKLAFGLHVIGFAALLLGCATPCWTGLTDSYGITAYHGLLVDVDKDTRQWILRDFNEFRNVNRTNNFVGYLLMAVIFGLLAIFLELFLLQSFAFALFNASCGKKYNPYWLSGFSLLSGSCGIVCLVLYQQYTGNAVLALNIGIAIEFSRALVIVFVGTVLLGGVLAVCDRAPDAVSPS